MAVMLLTIRVLAWPRFLATTTSGTPFMTASEAHVCLRAWKVAGGVILARLTPSVIGLFCNDGVQGWPSLPSLLSLVNNKSAPARPAHHCSNRLRPSSVRTMWRGLPDLLSRIKTVPASGLKSCTSSRASSL